MSVVNNIALIVHILSIVGLALLLLLQVNKSPRKIGKGTLHAALTALIAGLVLVGIRSNLHDQNAEKWPLFDHTKIGVKLVILIVITVLIIRNEKKSSIENSLWFTLIGLTFANILIALLV
ncbi:MAG: hypothetical protein WDO06_08905 [Actinomycetota bacterium]